MTWFKVDDGLHSHLKAMRAGAEAMGLWVLAGSWSADQLTDGWVPEYAALRITSNAMTHAESLVRAGLWEPGKEDGDPGWWFHDWTDHQPTRDEVERRRDEARERMRRLRSGSRDVRANADRTSEEVRDPRPVPSRPDQKEERGAGAPPTPGASEKAKTRKGARIPEDFAVTTEMAAWATTNVPGIDAHRETEKFRDYWLSESGSRASKIDWVRAWQLWLRKAQDWGPGSTSAVTPKPLDMPSFDHLHGVAAAETAAGLIEQVWHGPAQPSRDDRTAHAAWVQERRDWITAHEGEIKVALASRAARPHGRTIQR